MDDDRDTLIEKVAGAHRARDQDGAVVAEPAWWDLDEDGRREALERAIVNRQLEAALDPEGLSATARAVLARIGEG